MMQFLGLTQLGQHYFILCSFTDRLVNKYLLTIFRFGKKTTLNFNWIPCPLKYTQISIYTTGFQLCNSKPILKTLERLSKLRRRRQRQRERHQTKGVKSKTIAVHVRYKSLYISLPFSAKHQRETTKFCVVYGTWTTTAKFSQFHLKLNAVIAYLA